MHCTGPRRPSPYGFPTILFGMVRYTNSENPYRVIRCRLERGLALSTFRTPRTMIANMEPPVQTFTTIIAAVLVVLWLLGFLVTRLRRKAEEACGFVPIPLDCPVSMFGKDSNYCAELIVDFVSAIACSSNLSSAGLQTLLSVVPFCPSVRTSVTKNITANAPSSA